MPYVDRFRDVFTDYSALMGSALILLLVAVAHLYLRAMSRAAIRETALSPMGAADAAWMRDAFRHSVRRITPPVVLLLWVYGLQMALTLLLADGASPAVARLTVLARWLYGVLLLAGLVWLLVRVGRAVEELLVTIAARTPGTWDDVWLSQAGTAVRRLLPLLALILGTPALSVSPELASILTHASCLGDIGVVAFIAMQMVNTAAALVLGQHRLNVPDEAVRAELSRVRAASTHWDGRVNVLQVTDATSAPWSYGPS